MTMINSLVSHNQKKVDVRFSPLQLLTYFFTDISFKVNESYSPDEEKDLSFECLQYKIGVSKKEKPNEVVEKSGHENNYWDISLSVYVDEEVVGNRNFPYFFRFNVSGFFSTRKSDDELLEEKFAKINGPSILYGVIRDIATTLFSKGPVSMPTLPTVSFYFPPKEEKDSSKN